MSKLYIAYGSNMDRPTMRRRCPDARPLGKFMLTKAQLVFRGVADVEYHPTAETPCVLWRISKQDERELDQIEGVPLGRYFKSEDIQLALKGERHNALIYLMTSQGIYPPSEWYAGRIRRAYRDWGIDTTYLDEAIRRSHENKNPHVPELERRARQRQDIRQQALAMPDSPAPTGLDPIKPNTDWRPLVTRYRKLKPKKAEEKKASTTVLTSRNAVIYGD